MARQKKNEQLVLRATPRHNRAQGQGRERIRGGGDDSYPREREGRSWLWWCTKWLFILGIWCFIFLAGVLAYFAADLPDITRAAKFEKQTSITVKASDGRIIARYGEIKGKSIRVQDMPKFLVQAVLATEDRRFYEHPGVDIIGIMRAVTINTIKGRYVQGGSTITQQLAKNLFLTHDRHIKRKIQEALLALWLEHELSKDEILSAYMNRVYLGSGIYGMDAAANLYFGKSVKDITLQEAAILAGLLKAPSKYSPLNNPKLANERAEVVLSAMEDAGYITKAQIKKLKTQKSPAPAKNSNARAIKYFADWVIDGLDEVIGTPDMDIVVETTLDFGIQNDAEKSLITVLQKEGGAHKITQGSVMVMRPDGGVLAMVGGKDYGLSEFNRAVQAFRAAGSSFKPVVFLTALEQGWRPESMILDAPITDGKYKPQNFGDKYYGNVTLADALAQSMNTATVRLMKDVTPASVLDTAKRMGIFSKLEPNLSTGLGSSGVSMLEMTTAYATLANGGYRVFPYAITKITDSEGKELYVRKAQQPSARVLDAGAVHDLGRMMQGVINYGTGQKAKLPFMAAGKTGTSQESRDSWFIGYSDQVVASVWLGNDDNSPMKNVTGGGFPAQIWREIMLAARDKYPSNGVFTDSKVTASHIMPAAGDLSATQRQDNSADDSISGLIGRLLEGEENAPQNAEKPAADFENLNQ